MPLGALLRLIPINANEASSLYSGYKNICRAGSQVDIHVALFPKRISATSAWRWHVGAACIRYRRSRISFWDFGCRYIAIYRMDNRAAPPSLGTGTYSETSSAPRTVLADTIHLKFLYCKSEPHSPLRSNCAAMTYI
jgi:hypothetical protein